MRNSDMCAGKCTPILHVYTLQQQRHYNIYYPLASRYWLANITEIRGIYFNSIIHRSPPISLLA